MDLAKVPNERKLYLCRWYFRVGFALLPFVWTINAIWFFNEAFRKPVYEEQKHIKKYYTKGRFFTQKPPDRKIGNNEAAADIDVSELLLLISAAQLRDVILSAIGSSIWLVILVTWVTIFQLNRASWGEFADYISFIIPVGTP